MLSPCRPDAPAETAMPSPCHADAPAETAMPSPCHPDAPAETAMPSPCQSGCACWNSGWLCWYLVGMVGEATERALCMLPKAPASKPGIAASIEKTSVTEARPARVKPTERHHRGIRRTRRHEAGRSHHGTPPRSRRRQRGKRRSQRLQKHAGQLIAFLKTVWSSTFSQIATWGLGLATTGANRDFSGPGGSSGVEVPAGNAGRESANRRRPR